MKACRDSEEAGGGPLELNGGTLWIRGPLSIRGDLWLPGDKSISHRALLFASVAENESRIFNLATGDDVAATIRLISLAGVESFVEYDGSRRVAGSGFAGISQPAAAIDCGNSGTTMRMGAGLLSGRPHFAVLNGDSSLCKRPMSRIIRPLTRMGASIIGAGGNRFPPLVIRGSQLKGIDYDIEVASAQVKGALILAGLQASGETRVRLPAPTRDHSERILAALGCEIESDDREVRIRPSRPQGFEMRVPGDISSAAFFMAAAALCPGSQVVLRSVSLNPSRLGIVDALKSMGVRVEINERDLAVSEPYGDIEVKYSPELSGIDIAGSDAALLIDEIPILACLAARASQRSSFRDLAELRGKESDRIAVLCGELRRAGVVVEEYSDGFELLGGGLSACKVSSHGDHRIAMAFAAVFAGCEGLSAVTGFDASAVSYPEFARDLASLAGLNPDESKWALR